MLMRTIYKIGKTRVELLPPDLDNDGRIGGIEKVQMRGSLSEVIPAQQKSETAEAMENLNKDIVDNSRLSSMDFLSRIHPAEYHGMTRIDILIALKFLPSDTSMINRSKMRKSISLQGEGRKEIVSMATGNQAMQNERFSKLRSFFGGGKRDEQQ